jgi:hypothetical protein
MVKRLEQRQANLWPEPEVKIIFGRMEKKRGRNKVELVGYRALRRN